MEVYILHINWQMDNEHDIKVFRKKEDALKYIESDLDKHKNKKGETISHWPMTTTEIATVVNIIGEYDNECEPTGRNYGYPFRITLTKQKIL